MTDDLPSAFDLAARADALAGPDPLDRISLMDHVVAAEIGAFEGERGHTQRLRFDIVAEVRIPEDAGDDVDRILSYDRLSEAVATELASERLALLETLAGRVAARILREPQAERVFLRVQKLDRGPGELGVEIVRSRREAPAPAQSLPAPRILLVGPEVEPGPLLDRWLGRGAALLLLAGASPSAPAAARTPEAERRIALLALDQSAWALSSRDSRLLVAGSRTELDWALRRDRPAVWAPARLTLDTPGAPESVAPQYLAAWLAQRLGAVDTRLAGLDMPPSLAWPTPLGPALP